MTSWSLRLLGIIISFNDFWSVFCESSLKYYKQHLIQNPKTWVWQNQKKTIQWERSWRNNCISQCLTLFWFFILFNRVVSLTSDIVVTSKLNLFPDKYQNICLLNAIHTSGNEKKKKKVIYNICLIFYHNWKLWATWNS